MSLDIEAILAEVKSWNEKFQTNETLYPNVGMVQFMTLAAEIERLQAQVDRIKVARSNHPKCDKYEDDEGITCGWMRAVQDIDRALEETE